MKVRAEALTWQHALFAVERGGTVVYVLRDQRGAGAFLDAFTSGALDRQLRAMLDAPPRRRLTRRRARRRVAPVPTGSLVGLEHEYTVLAGDGRLDFRTLVHTLPIRGVRADPSDPNAYRCTWGGVITCDGREAEIAIPPVDVEPGFTDRVLASAGRGKDELEALLPDARLDGYSTHVSVSSTGRRGIRHARRYAETFAPALMLLMDRRSSPGLLIRPRPGRLELCGEHVDGETARAVVTFAVGSVRALARPNRTTLAHLRVRVRVEPAGERYGLYVDRRAFGPDLYESGRGARLALAGSGETRSAQQQLEGAWELARAALDGAARPSELDAVDRLVRGERPLPCESGR